MSEAEILQLARDVKEAQGKLCEERHGSIEKRLDKIELSQDKMFWWLLGIMATAIINLIVLLVASLRG